MKTSHAVVLGIAAAATVGGGAWWLARRYRKKRDVEDTDLDGALVNLGIAGATAKHNVVAAVGSGDWSRAKELSMRFGAPPKPDLTGIKGLSAMTEAAYDRTVAWYVGQAAAHDVNTGDAAFKALAAMEAYAALTAAKCEAEGGTIRQGRDKYGLIESNACIKAPS